jgi:hypothetical protein
MTYSMTVVETPYSATIVSATMNIVQGDTAPPVLLTLYANGAIANLTGVTATMVVSRPGYTSVVVPLSTSGTPTDGTLSHSWSAGETDEFAPGAWQYHVVGTSSGQTATFPSNGSMPFNVLPKPA